MSLRDLLEAIFDADLRFIEDRSSRPRRRRYLASPVSQRNSGMERKVAHDRIGDDECNLRRCNQRTARIAMLHPKAVATSRTERLSTESRTDAILRQPGILRCNGLL